METVGFMILVNLNEAEQAAHKHKLKYPDTTKPRHALKLSLSPKFIGTKGVGSCTNHKYKKTVRCWVFETQLD